ncbi:MAG TPA: DUF2125 domain-containing protein [Thermohalobaculum sp.]|nr:DUF2125 domain-containing protein [Thermohalobaculum sp.]
MKKIRNATIAAFLLVAAGWSALWFFGRGEIDTIVDGELARLRASGYEIEHGARTVGGFPFSYRVTYHDVTLRDPGTGTLYHLPRIAPEINAAEPDRLTIHFPEKFRIEMPLDQAARDAMPGMPPALAVDVEASGLKVVAAGLHTPDRQFFLTADSLLAVTGDTEQPLNLAVEMTGLDAALSQPPSGPSTGRAAMSSFEYSFTELQPVGASTAEGSAKDLRLTISSDTGGTGFQAALAGTGTSKTAYQTGAAEGALRTLDGEGTVNGEFTYAAASTAGTLTIAHGSAELKASSRANTAAVVSAPTPDLPSPTALGAVIAAVEFQLTTPILPRAEAAPFTLRLALDGAEPDPALWALIDGEAKLPREPATLIVDLEGTGRIPPGAAIPRPGEAQPFEFGTLSIKTVDLSLLGASLAARGEVAFEPVSQQPTGQVTVTLIDALALPGRLAEIGLIDQASAAMAMMMAETLTEPGATPAERVARIEMTEGAMTVNGQRF